ncbi:MAG: hypothetical protein AABW90_03195 [Nanoarchaeota archaeon]
MEESTTFNTIIIMIILALVLVVAIFSIIKLNASGLLKDLFPDFEKKDRIVSWNKEFFLEHPELMVYYIEGRDANIYISYSVKPVIRGTTQIGIIGWSWWSVEKEEWWAKDAKGWLSASTQHTSFKKLSSKNQEFISQLAGKSPEEGLKLIVERVLRNEEENYIYDVVLRVYFGKKVNGKWEAERKYESDSGGKFVLKDLDGLIDIFNQISRGVVRKRDAGRF